MDMAEIGANIRSCRTEKDMTMEELGKAIGKRCLALLYVSAEEEEWELDREDLEGRVPLAYVANLDAPDCSELGSIGIAPANGGLVRTE